MSKPRRRYPEPERPRLSLASVWHLFFAVGYKRPLSWAERRQLRLRASFFLVLGIVLTLVVQGFLLGRWVNCPKP